MRTLIVSPDPSMPGGVSSYYAAIREHMGSGTDFFTVGSRQGESGLLALVLRLVKDTAALRGTVRRGGYDFVVFNPSMHEKAVLRDGVLMTLARARGTRRIVFFRGWVDTTERRIRQHFLSLFRWAYFKADAVLVLSSEFKARLLEMGYAGPIYLETTAVPDFVFERSRQVGRTEGNRNARGAFNVLFLSRMDVEKGIQETLDAFRILRERHREISLTLAGDGPLLQWAKTYAAELGLAGVRFPGYVEGEEKAGVFEAADVFCFPSHHEGMPNSVLEAMAYGLPVVTRPVGGLRDFFEDGRMGFMTESLDPRVIADLIERLYQASDRRVSMGRFNRDYADEHFRASRVASRLRKIFEDTAATAKVAPATA